VKVQAITTFNRSGLEEYGRNMTASWKEYCDIPLRVYSEGWDEPLTDDIVDLHSVSLWLADFKRRNANLATAKNIKYQAVRFSHKVAAVCDAAQDDIDYLIWVDGDVVAHAKFGEEQLEGLLPIGDEWVAWLDRGKFFPECGFYILNCNHPKHEFCMGCYEALYTQDILLKLPGWTDCHALEFVVEHTGVKAKSLSGPIETHHPLINGPLGQWFDHLKGKRKSSGKSDKMDLKVERTEPYWVGVS
jgi:hypothetical protein